MQKKTRLIYSHLDRSSLVNKGFIIWPKRKLFLAGPTREISSGQDRPILQNVTFNWNSQTNLAYIEMTFYIWHFFQAWTSISPVQSTFQCDIRELQWVLPPPALPRWQSPVPENHNVTYSSQSNAFFCTAILNMEMPSWMKLWGCAICVTVFPLITSNFRFIVSLHRLVDISKINLPTSITAVAQSHWLCLFIWCLLTKNFVETTLPSLDSCACCSSPPVSLFDSGASWRSRQRISTSLTSTVSTLTFFLIPVITYETGHNISYINSQVKQS